MLSSPVHTSIVTAVVLVTVATCPFAQQHIVKRRMSWWDRPRDFATGILLLTYCSDTNTQERKETQWKRHCGFR